MVPPRARRLVLLALPVVFLLTRDEIPGAEAPASNLNFLLDISREFLGSAVEQDIERTEPVCDVILKTRIRGTGRTVARVAVDLVPNEQVAVVDFVTTGTTNTQTVGVNGPVQLYSNSTIPFQIRQRVYFSPQSVLADGTWSHAQTQSTLTDISTNFRCLLDRLITKVAYKQYQRDKERAESIAARHAEEKLNATSRAEAEPKLEEAEQSLKNYLADLRAQGMTFASVRFSSSQDTFFVRAQVAVPGRAAFGPPPPLKERSYLALRVHEAMVNEISRAKLAGETYTGEQLEKEAKKLGSGKTPKQPDDTDWSITFAKEKPLEVAFADQGLRATMRLAEFTSGANEYSGMNMTVKYKLQTAGDKIKAVRQGPIEAFPPGFKPGQKLSGRQQVMRTVLQKRFGKVFKEELVLPALELPKDLQKAGPLVATRAEAEHGWLLLTWRQGKADQ